MTHTMTIPLDTEQQARRNSVVYRCLTPSPAQALLFGNGTVGGSVHTPDDSLRIQVARGDIWNEQGNMGAIAAVRVRGNPGFFDRARTVRQECSLAEAAITIAVDDVTFRLTAIRGHDVLVLDIEDHRSQSAPFTVTLEDWHADDETTLTETVHVNRTSDFEAMNRRVGIEPGPASGPDPLLGRAWGLFLDRSQPRRILITTACSTAGADAARQIGRQLLAQARPHADAWLAEHARWWRDFWSRSAISLSSATGDAEYEERLWYVTLYMIACGSGGPYPLRFNGGPFLLDGDARSWDGGYWFQNMREVYWPLLASGHWEFMRDFFRLYFDAGPFVRAQTRNLFQIDALCYRETQTFWGMDVGANLQTQQFNPVTHRYFSGNTECCLLMDWYYRASGDETFLREEFYPFLSEILEFYRQYATRSSDGVYHLSPVSSLETWLDVRDDMPNLCGLHYFLPRAIAWGERFGERPAVLDPWRDLLKHLAPLPVGRWTVTRRFMPDIPSVGIHNEEYAVESELRPDGLFLPAAALLKDKSLRCNMENAELYAIYPWGFVGMDSPSQEVRRAENTWNNRTWRYQNNGWAQDAVQLARMGWSDRAKEALLDHANCTQRFPNGTFINAAAPRFHGLLTDTPYFDTAGVHATALTEMLLQSYDGTVRICPATTAEWSGRFKLHALGGFVVEAAFEHGQPVIAQITATRPAVLRLRWDGKLIERDMRAGETVTLSQDSGVANGVPIPAIPEIVYPGYKMRPPLRAHLTGHWHDERKGHGQIGLAEDGEFPATRNAKGTTIQ